MRGTRGVSQAIDEERRGGRQAEGSAECMGAACIATAERRECSGKSCRAELSVLDREG